jgi:hypothetical protein
VAVCQGTTITWFKEDSIAYIIAGGEEKMNLLFLAVVILAVVTYLAILSMKQVFLIAVAAFIRE